MYLRFAIGIVFVSTLGHAQVVRHTYHDAERKHIKEFFQVRDTIRNVFEGPYISYFLNGNVESKGQFVSNETTGVWEFFYETGNLKMRGILRQNTSYGLWEYFYESGQKSMEGMVFDKQREGNWKIYYESGRLKETGMYTQGKRQGFWQTYFEDGALRGEIEYDRDHGRYVEYNHQGKVVAEGPRQGTRNVGHWRYFGEKGLLESEGDFEAGQRTGAWKYYYPSGRISCEGAFARDQPEGTWTYYFEDGKVSASGAYVAGQKDGIWTAQHPNGSRKSEAQFEQGTGTYTEYGADGRLKLRGQFRHGQYHGLWEYFYPDGKKEGTCEYVEGKGTYYGYYPNGTLQTKGQMEEDRRVGTWELYESDGRLSGYYKPVYEGGALAQQITARVNPPAVPAPARTERRTGFYYFKPLYTEYRGVIISTNPFLPLVHRLPVSIEFYNQERLGHEFEFEGIRNPFFESDGQVGRNRLYTRGYAIALKQKLYHHLPTGMWYFAHEVRFTNIGHFSNRDIVQGTPGLITASASEQRAEYGWQLGVRLMQFNDGDGFTLDGFIGYGIGFRSFDVEPLYQDIFASLNQRRLSQSFRFGLSLGYAFSFDGRRRRR